jgi:hypothetical protein
MGVSPLTPGSKMFQPVGDDRAIVALKRRAMETGRYTLPIDLPSDAGAGPAVQFEGLAGEDLCALDLSLSPQSSKRAAWGIGFALAALAGMALLRARRGRKFAFVLMLLVAATLVAFCWPAAVWPANGAFYGGLAVIAFYLLVWIGGAIVKSLRRSSLASLALVLLLVCVAAPRALAGDAGVQAPPAPLVIPYEGDPRTLPDDKDAKVLVPLARYAAHAGIGVGGIVG